MRHNRIFGWADGKNGCSFYRLECPLAVLAERHRVETAVSVRATDEVVFDPESILIAQRLSRLDTSSLIDSRIGYGYATAVEYDDLVWDVPEGNGAHATFMRPDVLARIRLNLQQAHVVLVSTPPLAEEVRRYAGRSDDVYVVPNRVPRALLDLPLHRHGEDVVLIGYPASPSHAVDIHVVRDALQRTVGGARRSPKVFFVSIGTDFRRELGVHGSHIPWTSDLSDYYQALDFDILIAPLAVNAFNDSKSPIKAMEAGARGIPTVASDFGPYRRYVTPGEDGLLCSTTEEWVSALRTLIEDRDLREEMGRNARFKAEMNCYDDHAESWLGALSHVPAPPRAVIRRPGVRRS